MTCSCCALTCTPCLRSSWCHPYPSEWETCPTSSLTRTSTSCSTTSRSGFRPGPLHCARRSGSSCTGTSPSRKASACAARSSSTPKSRCGSIPGQRSGPELGPRRAAAWLCQLLLRAREPVERLPVERLAVERFAVERLAVERLLAVELAFFAVELVFFRVFVRAADVFCVSAVRSESKSLSACLFVFDASRRSDA